MSIEVDFDLIPDESFLREGRYYVRITDAKLDQGKYDDWGFVLTMTCVAGENAGKTITDRVWTTWQGDPTHKICSRLKIFMKEIGLLPQGGGKRTIDPEELIGKEFWVDVVTGEPYTSKRTGKTITPSQIDFAGYEAGPRPDDYNPPKSAPQEAASGSEDSGTPF